MAKEPTPKSTEPLAAYRVEGGKFAAYNSHGLAWLVSETEAERLGIREAGK